MINLTLHLIIIVQGIEPCFWNSQFGRICRCLTIISPSSSAQTTRPPIISNVNLIGGSMKNIQPQLCTL